ncbi:fatty acid desaturase [Rhodococcus sp. NBC_00294]|uniref:fatty acid desaturase n=1 Tax=Rhodococcus sp. NBC_00294 TaxID=2976004 RepID=UPI002E28E8A3|nr:fatty acid desaturase [Rhodococcus sp. NBC_00294]
MSESTRAREGGVPVLSEAQAAAVRNGVPDPGISLPRVAVPTAVLWAVSFAMWLTATAIVLSSASRWWLLLTIPIHAFVTFSMFTVLHESVHHAAGRLGWVNDLLGRVSLPFVTVWGSFPMVKFIHIEHHRNTNEDVHSDPDAWTEHGPWWQLPFRWMAIDLWYARFYSGRFAQRPRRERIGIMVNLATVVALVAVVLLTGHGWEFALIYLIPQRLGLAVLAWWFDWLPHHDLGVTARTDRFRATRVRVGWERVVTPLMFYQNYHLVHHIHPTIPFYRYVNAWNNTRDDYLTRNVPISTAWGTELTASEYRAWREITSAYSGTAHDVDPSDRVRFHKLRVAEVRRLTADSVSITFDLPDSLRRVFAFDAGQNVTVRCVVDGTEVRRSYSLCTVASSGVVRIAVRRVDGGAMSSFLNDQLSAGDTLDVLPPTGRFVPTGNGSEQRADRPRVLSAIAAGSGITPIISILSTVLTEDDEARAVLYYANRDQDSTMFGPELTMLCQHFEGRLRVVHFLSRGTTVPTDDDAASAQYEDVVASRLTADELGRRVRARTVCDEWYLCGPEELIDDAVSTLEESGTDPRGIHREHFVSAGLATGESRTHGDAEPSFLTVTLAGAEEEIDTDGDESLLEASLRSGVNAPYSCTGGACGTCRAFLHSGTVNMEQNYALTDDEVDAGWVLTCQSRPSSPAVTIDYDATEAP